MKEKTKFFKFIAFAISFILLLTTFSTLSVAAISATLTGSITITGVEEGVTVSIYQLTTVNVDSSGQPESPLYSWVNTTLKSWVETNFSSYVEPDNFASVADDSTTAQEFYTTLAATIKGGTTLGLSPTSNEVGNTDSITFSGCAMGTYLIIIEGGLKIYSPLVANLIPEYDEDSNGWFLNNVTTSAKSTSPQISKEITNTDTSFSLYDTISYEIVADIPSYPANSVSTSYYISDKLSDGLTLDTTSIKVYGENSSGVRTLLSAGTHYTLTTNANTSRPSATSTSVSFLITFVYAQIKDYTKVAVTYDATLNENAIGTNGGGITNNAYLDYSNNPYLQGSTIVGQELSEDDVPTIYLYGIKVNKVDSSDGTSLSGAVFELRDADNNLLYFVEKGDGVYYLADNTDGDKTTELAVGSDTNKGILEIYGLSEGTYYLEEIQAPSGYTKSTTIETIVISDNDKDGKIDPEGSTTGGTSHIYTLTFKNSEGFTLPVTGGMGIAIFTASGIVLICLGIALFVFVMKKRKTNK